MAQMLEYIEVHDNRQRPHSTLGCLGPDEFELSLSLERCPGFRGRISICCV